MTVLNAGNLLSRTLGLLRKNCQSTLVVDSTIAVEGIALKDTVEKLVSWLEISYNLCNPCNGYIVS